MDFSEVVLRPIRRHSNPRADLNVSNLEDSAVAELLSLTRYRGVSELRIFSDTGSMFNERESTAAVNVLQSLRFIEKLTLEGVGLLLPAVPDLLRKYRFHWRIHKLILKDMSFKPMLLGKILKALKYSRNIETLEMDSISYFRAKEFVYFDKMSKRLQRLVLIDIPLTSLICLSRFLRNRMKRWFETQFHLTVSHRSAAEFNFKRCVLSTFLETLERSSLVKFYSLQRFRPPWPFVDTQAFNASEEEYLASVLKKRR